MVHYEYDAGFVFPSMEDCEIHCYLQIIIFPYFMLIKFNGVKPDI